MDSRKLIWTGMLVGTTLGTFVPILWGGSELSFSSIIWSAIGGFVGIYIAYQMSR